MGIRLAFAGSVLVALLVQGCASVPVPLRADLPENELPAKAYPAVFGLLLDQDFKDYAAHTWTPQAGGVLSYKLGEVSAKIFQDAMSKSIEEVIPVTAKPPYTDADKKKIQYTVYPQIAGFHGSRWSFSKSGEYNAEVEYFVTVYDDTGRVAMEKTYSVTGIVKGKTMADDAANYAAPVESAMRRIMAQFLEDIGRLNNVQPEPEEGQGKR